MDLMDANEKELERARVRALDEQERLAYLQNPITPDEFVTIPNSKAGKMRTMTGNSGSTCGRKPNETCLIYWFKFP